MKKVSVEEVRSFVLAKLQTRLAANGLTPQAVPDDFDLFVEGIVDSMGLIELITAVEQNFEIRIDFEDLDPKTCLSSDRSAATLSRRAEFRVLERP